MGQIPIGLRIDGDKAKLTNVKFEDAKEDDWIYFDGTYGRILNKKDDSLIIGNEYFGQSSATIKKTQFNSLDFKKVENAITKYAEDTSHK